MKISPDPSSRAADVPRYRPHRDAPSIRRMFADIAPTYDFLNHFLSANRDRSWRRKAMGLAGIRPDDRILDVCAGTGDLALEASRHLDPRRGGRVVATDFCPEMVRLARRKCEGPARRRRDGAVPPPLLLAVADTLRLPFAAGSFDAVTVGFGIRNVGDLHAGLVEMNRILKPGGRAVILEFTTPRSRFFRRLFGLYFHHILPRLGRWLSAAQDKERDDAYRYLPDSVARFPSPGGLGAALEQAGFVEVTYRLLTLGIAAVHIGVKPDPRSGSQARRGAMEEKRS